MHTSKPALDEDYRDCAADPFRQTAPLAAPDRVYFVPTDSREVRLVAAATGPAFNDWYRYWHSLEPDERDTLTEPAWVAGFLAGGLAARNRLTYAMFVTSGCQTQAVLPINHLGNGALRHARGFPSRSWPLAVSHQRPALDALFASRIEGTRVRSLHLDCVEAANPLRNHSRSVDSRHHFRALIDVRGGLDRVLAGMSKSARKDIRRQARRLREESEVEFEAVTGGTEIDSAFRRFLAVDDLSWKGRDGSLLGSDVTQREALRAALRHSARFGRAAVHFLRVDGRDAAAQLCVIIDKQLHIAKMSFDNRWAQYGLGKLLMAETIRQWCPDHGVESLNMVSGLPWQLRWNPTRINTHELWLFDAGPRGWVARALDVPPREQLKAIARSMHLEAVARRVLQRDQDSPF